MNMMDILRQAHGGNGIGNLARQFGLDADQTEQIIAIILPAVSTAFKQRVQSAGGLDGILRQLQGNGYESIYEDPNSLARDDIRVRGNDVLSQIFGSKDVSRSVALRTEKSTGIGAALIKSMLPIIVSMVLGGMQKKTSRDSGMSGVLGDLLKGVVGGSGNQSSSGGGGLDDILRQILEKRQTQSAPPQSQNGGGGLGGILGGLFGGNRASVPQRDPTPSPGSLRDTFGDSSRRQAQPREIHPQGQNSTGELQDMLGGIFGTAPKQRQGTGDKNLDSVLGMFDSDGDGQVDMDVLRQLSRGK